MVLEHTQEQIEKYGSCGLMSTESSENLNHLMKVLVNAQARGSGDNVCVDVLWMILQRGMPRVRAMFDNEELKI